MSMVINEKYNSVILGFKGKLIGGPLGSEVNDALHKFLDEGKKNVVVDLKDVSLVNSSGIGILISGLTTMKNGGGNLKLANISNKIQGLLSMTKLNKIFEQYNSVDEAAKSF